MYRLQNTLFQCNLGTRNKSVLYISIEAVVNLFTWPPLSGFDAWRSKSRVSRKCILTLYWWVQRQLRDKTYFFDGKHNLATLSFNVLIQYIQFQITYYSSINLRIQWFLFIFLIFEIFNNSRKNHTFEKNFENKVLHYFQVKSKIQVLKGKILVH